MNRVQHPSGPRLLLDDLIIALRVADDMRERAVERVFGVSRDGSFIITMIALGAVVDGVHGATVKVKTKAKSSPPSAGDTFIGATVVKETVRSITGIDSRDRRFVGTLILTAVVAKSCRPVVAGAVRHAKTRSRRVITTLRRQYGG
jgi:hypothetical protein